MKFALLRETAKAPTRKHETDAGIDLYADMGYTYDTQPKVEIFPNEYAIVNTGVTVEIPKGFFGWITNKSKNNFLIGGGIVDEGYQGELLVKVINPTGMRVTINHHDPIAQLLILPCLITPVEIVDKSKVHKESSSRGADGGIARQAKE